MPRTNTRVGNWDYELRRQLKNDTSVNQYSWKVLGRGKKTRATIVLEDGSRPSVELPIEWRQSNRLAIANEIGVLSSIMRDEKIGLKAAFERTQQVESTVTATDLKTGVIDWQSVAADLSRTFFDA